MQYFINMMFRSHLALGVFIALAFLPKTEHPLFFIPAVLVSSLLPDIDTVNSFIGRRAWFFRPMQWIIRHRSFIHSFTFCFFVTIFLMFYFPLFALPFFLGYGVHLFADALTIDGIRPFWPSKEVLSGKIRTGGKVEAGIFTVLVIIDIVLSANIFFKFI